MSSDIGLGTAVSGAGALLDTTVSQKPSRLDDAAKQFEALMITQMMKTVREGSGESWLSEGDETGEDTSMGMAEQQFAQTLANNGGLGLAKMIVKSMTRPEASANPAKADEE